MYYFFRIQHWKVVGGKNIISQGKWKSCVIEVLYSLWIWARYWKIPFSECLISIGKINKPRLIPEIVPIDSPIHGWDTLKRYLNLSINFLAFFFKSILSYFQGPFFSAWTPGYWIFLNGCRSPASLHQESNFVHSVLRCRSARETYEACGLTMILFLVGAEFSRQFPINTKYIHSHINLTLISLCSKCFLFFSGEIVFDGNKFDHY